MPVQGSIDTFPVRGLLEFLALTERTGRLVVHAEPCLGLVALREGRLVGAGVGADASMPALAASPSVTSLGDVLADVVTWPSGRFAFHPDGVGGNARGFEVGETLAAIDELLRRHGDDSELTTEHVVQLNEEPGFRRVHLDHEHWQIISAVGTAPPSPPWPTPSVWGCPPCGGGWPNSSSSAWPPSDRPWHRRRDAQRRRRPADGGGHVHTTRPRREPPRRGPSPPARPCPRPASS